jgi:hypothetical protein
MRRASWICVGLGALLCACSGSSSNPDSGLDAGADLDTDSDSYLDCVAPQRCVDADFCGVNYATPYGDPYNCTGEETCCFGLPDTDPDDWISATAPWDWKDLPQGEDCGSGCRQLTFAEEIRAEEWDVWGDYLVYVIAETDSGGMYVPFYVSIVDVAKSKSYRVPPAQMPPFDVWSGHPAIWEGQVVYETTASGWLSEFARSALIHLDIVNETQDVVYLWPNSEDRYPKLIGELDIYGADIIAEGGCGTGDSMDGEMDYGLCLFSLPGLSRPEILIDEPYGNRNTIWEDAVAFIDGRNDLMFDVKGYDLDTKEFFPIASDPVYTEISPRLQGRRVVYGDLRFGTNQDAVMGDRNHEAIFVYDLDTQERTQITDGESICSEPDIWGDIVVWLDYRDCGNPNDVHDFSNIQVRGFNLSTKKFFTVTNMPTDKWPERPKETVRIWGDKVYVDMMSTDASIFNAIYMFDLPEGAR